MDFLQQNDMRLKQLHGLNRMYAETLITYLRQHVEKDAAAIEDTIAELLSDMLAVQTDGVTAKAHFGADPQTAADEILKQLPAAPTLQWVLQIWPMLNLLGLIALAMALMDRTLDEPFDLGQGLALLLLLPFVYVIVMLLRGMGFNHIQRKTKWRAAIALVLIVGFYAVMFAMPEMPLTLAMTQVAIIIGAATMLVANAAVSHWLPRLGLPWFGFWPIAGLVLVLLLVAALPAWAGVFGSSVVSVCGFALAVHQQNQFHFISQAARKPHA